MNSVEIESVKATLVRLAYGTNDKIDDKSKSRVHAVVTKYVMESHGRQLFQFLIQPVLTAIADYPERPAPFNVLLCLLVKFQKWKTTDPVLRAAATTLKTLVGLFSSKERLLSLCHKIYPALQSCISLLDGRLKPPAVDGIAYICFLALESDDWTHKVGALEVLATLVRCAHTTTTALNNKESNTRTLLTDFLDLAAITAQRQAHFNSSERVKEAAFSLLSTIECPVEPVDAISKPTENSVSAESIEPLVFDSNSGDNVVETHQELHIPLALTPLPEFSKELSEDELGYWRNNQIATAEAASVAAASPSCIGSVPDTIQQHSPVAFSMLGSEMQSFNSAIEVDIENFLRGSILPNTTGAGNAFFGGNAGGVQQTIEEEEDVYSEGWDDFLHPSISNNLNVEENVTSSDNNTLINIVLGKALEELFQMHQDGEGIINYNLTTENIEHILRTCLDIHSEKAYEHHLQRAEAILVRSSQELQGKPDADGELQRRVQVLENDVHRAVAEQQAQFMESIVPKIADILANPYLLERLLVQLVG